MRAEDTIVARLYVLLREALKKLPSRSVTLVIDEWDLDFNQQMRGGKPKPDDLKMLTQRPIDQPGKIWIKVMFEGDYEKEVQRPGRVFEL